MFVHVLKALGQLLHPRFLWLLLKTFSLTAVILGALYAGGVYGLGGVVEAWTQDDLGRFGDILTGLVLLIVFVVIYLPVSALVLGLFADEAVRIVETRHYPATAGQREMGLAESVGLGLRFATTLLVVNLLALPFYLLLPGLNIVLFLILNGYLSGREYFEMVAARHVAGPEIRPLRRRFRLRLFLAGVFIAAILMVPVLNFVAPLFGAAFMVHVFQDTGRRARLFQGRVA
ncbi:MAG: EI24 domain-containing protein [Alphaproteobacteria bacterium]